MRIKKASHRDEYNDIVFEFEHGKYTFFMHLHENETDAHNLKIFINRILEEQEKRL